MAEGAGTHGAAGDESEAAYRQDLGEVGLYYPASTDVRGLGHSVCVDRANGLSGHEIITGLDGVSRAQAINIVGYGMFHFCPQYFDLQHEGLVP